MGELVKAMLFARAMKGLVGDAEMLAATAILERRPQSHRMGCDCAECDERVILGLDDEDD